MLTSYPKGEVFGQGCVLEEGILVGDECRRDGRAEKHFGVLATEITSASLISFLGLGV
jgi:hypothetical protein